MSEVTWRGLQKILSDLDEKTVLKMLEDECKANLPRLSIVFRLHQRYTMLRAYREREEIMKAIK
ncbi:hypothetical protein UFOVP1355_16 [uncultured Caudovirales phage]|uniref:Uncharacterized protein n=1 Tax=uncultured Caudovirales phage TaxID=2100421 RepID=A0A6J5RRT3_9CAUD|nr:hypothetical protein UFOVP1355_16 [uncultured Caudovirales phage]